MALLRSGVVGETVVVAGVVVDGQSPMHGTVGGVNCVVDVLAS